MPLFFMGADFHCQPAQLKIILLAVEKVLSFTYLGVGATR